MIEGYYIKRLILRNFRSYEEARINSEGKKNIIIIGENGAGKTNILEAISMLSISGPFRKAKLSQLGRIESNDKVMTISLNIKNEDMDDMLGISYNYMNKDNSEEESEDIIEKRSIIANGNNIQGQDLQNYIKMIWITPYMDRLFSEASIERRKFLDNLMSNFYKIYGGVLSQYNNLLKQRSKILKKEKYDNEWVSSIEEELVSLGVQIGALRLEFEEKLNKILERNESNFPNISIKISGIIEDELRKSKAIEVEEKYKEILKENRKMFKYSNSPSVEGIHRSDFTAYNKDKGISTEQTSTGEQKCSVISIILAYSHLQYLYFNKYPLILIDEAPAHLDEFKQESLYKELEKIPTQIWYTGITKEDFKYFENKESLYVKIEESKIILL